MTLQEANEIIIKERLENYVCIDESAPNKADKAVLCNRDRIWVTYLSDERGVMSEGSVRKHDTLGDALERLVRVAGAAKWRNEDY